MKLQPDMGIGMAQCAVCLLAIPTVRDGVIAQVHGCTRYRSPRLSALWSSLRSLGLTLSDLIV